MANKIDEAVEVLKRGGAVVFPTDTVYGIGVAVRYAPSPQVIYDIKRRDEGKPIAWLVSGVDALDAYGKNVAPRARELVRGYWPGALTVIVEASDAVPLAFRSQAGTVGLRMSAGEVALALVREVGPIAASSANVSGDCDPRAFREVDAGLIERVGACVESDGDIASGIASTVVDCSKGGLRILRKGQLAL